MKKGDYDTAKFVIEFADKLVSFAGDVDKLVEKWGTIAVQHEAEPEVVQAIVGKSFFGKGKKGTITAHVDFYGPLLTVLIQMGGTAKQKEAIALVGKLMAREGPHRVRAEVLYQYHLGSDPIRCGGQLRKASGAGQVRLSLSRKSPVGPFEIASGLSS